MLVIYHRNCIDGFCCAYLLKTVFSDAIFYGYNYGDDLPDISLFEDHDVILADVSFPRDALEIRHAVAKSFIVLDHHKTAEENLRGLPYCRFDMTKCGAELVWDYLSPGTEPSVLVKYVGDGDLWKFLLPYSRQIRAVLQATPHDFSLWALLDHDIRNKFQDLVTGGTWIERWTSKIVAEANKKAEPIELFGRLGGIVNFSCKSLVSEVAGTIAETRDFGICWWKENDMYYYSMRARNGQDISSIAKALGGGGHKQAAGFQGPFSPRELEQMYGEEKL